jgi:hypothetical protein
MNRLCIEPEISAELDALQQIFGTIQELPDKPDHPVVHATHAGYPLLRGPSNELSLLVPLWPPTSVDENSEIR